MKKACLALVLAALVLCACAPRQQADDSASESSSGSSWGSNSKDLPSESPLDSPAPQESPSGGEGQSPAPAATDNSGPAAPETPSLAPDPSQLGIGGVDGPDDPEPPSQAPDPVPSDIAGPEYTEPPEHTGGFIEGANPGIAEYAELVKVYKDFVVSRYVTNETDNYALVEKTGKTIADMLGVVYDDTLNVREAYELYCSLTEISQGAFGDLAYAVHDINSDGMPELVILMEDLTIYAIYTISDGTLALVGGFWSRYDCAIDRSGMLFIYGSSGADNFFTASYLIEHFGSDLVLIEMVGMEDYDEQTLEWLPEPRCYYISEGVKLIIEHEDAIAFWDVYPFWSTSNPTAGAGLDIIRLFIW